MRVTLMTDDGCVGVLHTLGGLVQLRFGRRRPVHAASVTELLDAFPGDDTDAVPLVELRPWPRCRADAVLLLAIAARWPRLLVGAEPSSARPYHIALSYALPFVLDDTWRTWAEEHAELLIRGRQLVAVPASDLLAVQPGADAEHRHRRLLRLHESTRVIEHRDLDAFLQHWSNFTTWRYGRALEPCERSALLAVLDRSDCTIREFVNAHETIARAVICRHSRSRTLFDLMVAWSPQHARWRPGIYTGVQHLIEAARLGFRFSLCYGNFPYKHDIVGSSTVLTLDDLLVA